MYEVGEAMATSSAMQRYPLLLEAELRARDLSLADDDVREGLRAVHDVVTVTTKIAAKVKREHEQAHGRRR